jgi:tetratricopeptide (TPR) repeat protein
MNEPLPLATSAELRAGDSIARYTVLRQLGAGGMGVVYEARDPELGRSVAVKVLPAGTRSSVVKLRLTREAQALAQLQHPNVVAVHDVGIAGERLFLAMELVDGKTLGEHLAERQASWKEVLALYLQAGRGLAAAHTKGLVHRDFKPSNVLVDRDGRVRVSDFGLARLQGADVAETPGEVATLRDGVDTAVSDDTTSLGVTTSVAAPTSDLLAAPLTAAGSFLGTPRYMAPEQFARLPATAASDQFSFCVALWESLYGQHPFAAANELGGLAAAVSGGRTMAPPLRRAPRGIRRALERGLSNDPGQRHPSMQVLLARLEAVPIRRRRVAMAAVGAALLMVVGVAVAATRPAPARTCARAEASALERIAPSWSPAVRERVRAVFVSVGGPGARASFDRVDAGLQERQRSWARAHRDACEATHVRGQQSPGLLDLRIQCLDRARAGIVALVDALGQADRGTVERAASAAQTVGDLDACRDGAQLAGAVPPPTAPAARQALADAERRIARLGTAYELGRFQAGVADVDGAIAAARGVGWQPVIARGLLAGARLQVALGQNDSGQTSLLAAIQAAADGHDDTTRAWASMLLVRVAGLAREDYEQAHLLLELARAAVKRVGDPAPMRVRLLINEGELLQRERRYAEALERLREANRVREAESVVDPVDHVAVLSSIGDVLRRLGEFTQAREYAERSLAVAEARLGPTHPEVAQSLLVLANTLNDLSDFAAAAEVAERGVAVRELEVGVSSEKLGAWLVAYSNAQISLGHVSEGRALLERTLAVEEAAHGVEHPTLVFTLSNLAVVMRLEGRVEASIPVLLRARAIATKAHGATSPTVALTCHNLGDAYEALNDLAAARASFECALRIWEPQLGLDNAEIQATVQGLARLDLREGHAARALKALLRSLAVFEKEMGRDSIGVCYLLETVAWAYLVNGDLVRAIEAIERATELGDQLGVAALAAGPIRFTHAKILWARNRPGDRSRALALAAEAATIMKSEPAFSRLELEQWRAEHRL